MSRLSAFFPVFAGSRLGLTHEGILYTSHASVATTFAHSARKSCGVSIAMRHDGLARVASLPPLPSLCRLLSFALSRAGHGRIVTCLAVRVKDVLSHFIGIVAQSLLVMRD